MPMIWNMHPGFIVTMWCFHGILNPVMKEIASSIIFIYSTEEVWKEPKERFSQGRGLKIFQIKKTKASSCQHDISVSEYHTKLEGIWDELLNHKPIPNCTCDSLKVMNEYQPKNIWWLDGIDDSFTHIRGHILLMEPMTPTNEVLALILQEE